MTQPKEKQEAELAEREIVQRIQAGEKELYRKLVSAHKDLVYAMIRRQVSDHELAEEIAQETFVKAYTNISSFRLDAKFSTWLVRIALNNTHSYYRSRKHKQSLRTDEFDAERHGQAAHLVQDEVEEKERIHQFRECFAKLSEKFQQVVSLCGLEEQSYEEAALIADVPVGTVRSRLNKARILLRDCMESHAGRVA